MCNCQGNTYNFQLGCSPQIKLANPNAYYDKQEIDEMIKDIIAGDIDLSGYVTDDRLADILKEYVKNGDFEALRQRLEEEMDKLSTEVEKRAQKEDIEALEERVDEVESKIDDVDGVTEEKVNELIKDKADKSELNDYQPKGDYALRNEIPNLEGYATEQWVTDKNYLTEHQHLKTVNGNSLIGDGNIIIEGGGESVDLSDYYTKGESDDRYAQKSVVDGLQSQIDDIDGQLSKKADESALEALQQEIDDISKSNDEVNQELGRIDSELDTVRDRVDSKADRSDLANYQPKGDYPTKDDINDLEERIEDLEIYDFEEYATKEWVEGQGYLTEHQHLKTINGESLVGDGNIVIQGDGGTVDLSDYYTKEESDARYGSKEEQESLRNDVEEALGESAKNEADLQNKADKSDLDAIRDELSEIRNQFNFSEPSVKYMTKNEYDELDVKGKHTFYVLTDANELWLGENKLFPMSDNGGSEQPSEPSYEGYKIVVTDIDGNENKVECNDSNILNRDEFRGLKTIKTAIIGDCVEEIGARTFISNEKMVSAKLPNTLKRIDDDAFHFCDSLKIELNEGLEYIGKRAFECCDSYLDVVIPSSVKEINLHAFFFINTEQNPIDYDYIDKNRKVRVMCTTPPNISTETYFGYQFDFNGSDATYPIYVPDASVDVYKQAEGWSRYANRIKPLSEYK